MVIHVWGIQLPADSPNATFFLLKSFLDQLRVFIGVRTPPVVLKPLPHHVNSLHNNENERNFFPNLNMQSSGVKFHQILFLQSIGSKTTNLWQLELIYSKRILLPTTHTSITGKQRKCKKKKKTGTIRTIFKSQGLGLGLTFAEDINFTNLAGWWFLPSDQHHSFLPEVQ